MPKTYPSSQLSVSFSKLSLKSEVLSSSNPFHAAFFARRAIDSCYKRVSIALIDLDQHVVHSPFAPPLDCLWTPGDDGAVIACYAMPRHVAPTLDVIMSSDAPASSGLIMARFVDSVLHALEYLQAPFRGYRIALLQLSPYVFHGAPSPDVCDCPDNASRRVGSKYSFHCDFAAYYACASQLSSSCFLLQRLHAPFAAPEVVAALSSASAQEVQSILRSAAVCGAADLWSVGISVLYCVALSAGLRATESHPAGPPHPIRGPVPFPVASPVCPCESSWLSLFAVLRDVSSRSSPPSCASPIKALYSKVRALLSTLQACRSGPRSALLSGSDADAGDGDVHTPMCEALVSVCHQDVVLAASASVALRLAAWKPAARITAGSALRAHRALLSAVHDPAAAPVLSLPRGTDGSASSCVSMAYAGIYHPVVPLCPSAHQTHDKEVFSPSVNRFSMGQAFFGDVSGAVPLLCAKLRARLKCFDGVAPSMPRIPSVPPLEPGAMTECPLLASTYLSSGCDSSGRHFDCCALSHACKHTVTPCCAGQIVSENVLLDTITNRVSGMTSSAKAILAYVIGHPSRSLKSTSFDHALPNDGLSWPGVTVTCPQRMALIALGRLYRRFRDTLDMSTDNHMGSPGSALLSLLAKSPEFSLDKPVHQWVLPHLLYDRSSSAQEPCVVLSARMMQRASISAQEKVAGASNTETVNKPYEPVPRVAAEVSPHVSAVAALHNEMLSPLDVAKEVAFVRQLIIAIPNKGARPVLLHCAAHGTPPTLWGTIWAISLGLPSFDKCMKLWVKALEIIDGGKCDKQILLDVPRCLAQDSVFGASQGAAKLGLVLRAFCAASRQKGNEAVYWQGLDAISACCLRCCPLEPVALQLLSRVLTRLLPAVVGSALPVDLLGRRLRGTEGLQLHVALAAFRRVLRFHDPALENHLQNIGFTPEFYALPWLLTLFAHVFPLDVVGFIWDFCLVAAPTSGHTGAAAVLSVSVAICCSLRRDLLLSDFNSLSAILSHRVLAQKTDIRTILRLAADILASTPPSILAPPPVPPIAESGGAYYVATVDGRSGLSSHGCHLTVPVVAAADVVACWTELSQTASSHVNTAWPPLWLRSTHVTDSQDYVELPGSSCQPIVVLIDMSNDQSSVPDILPSHVVKVSVPSLASLAHIRGVSVAKSVASVGSELSVKEDDDALRANLFSRPAAASSDPLDHSGRSLSSWGHHSRSVASRGPAEDSRSIHVSEAESRHPSAPSPPAVAVAPAELNLSSRPHPICDRIVALVEAAAPCLQREGAALVAICSDSMDWDGAFGMALAVAAGLSEVGLLHVCVVVGPDVREWRSDSP